MKLRNPVQAAVDRRTSTEERAITWEDFFSPSSGIVSRRSAAGKTVTTDTALQLSTVWGCVRILSDGVATLPIDSHIRRRGIRGPYPRPIWLSFGGGNLTAQAPKGKIDVLSEIMVSLLLDGNAFVATLRGRDGRVMSLEVLDPNAVTVETDPETRAVTYHVSTPAGPVEGTPLDILHIRGMTLPGQDRGLSPIAYARETIGLSLAAQEYGASFFGNGAIPAAVMEAPGPVSPAGQEAMRAGWSAIHQGSGNAHKIAILTEGAKITKLTVPPDDAQFLETRAFQVPDIARIYGVPVHLLQHANGPEMGQSLSDKNTHFVQHSLRAWVERVESALSWLMWTDGNPTQSFIKLNLDALMRGDHPVRYQTYSSAVQQGILTINEVRAMEDLPPVPWGDEPVSVQVQEQAPGLTPDPPAPDAESAQGDEQDDPPSDEDDEDEGDDES